jgi:hypothetical protein
MTISTIHAFVSWLRMNGVISILLRDVLLIGVKYACIVHSKYRRVSTRLYVFYVQYKALIFRRLQRLKFIPKIFKTPSLSTEKLYEFI